MNFSTAEICDEHFDKVMSVDPNFHNYGGAAKCMGEVVTIKLDKNNSDLEKILSEEDGSGKIVVVDAREDYYAMVDEPLMRSAQKNNYSGIIVNGYVRNVYSIKNIPIALYALGTCPHKYIPTTKGERDIKLVFGGVSFENGDYIYADTDGIIITESPLV